MDNIVLRSDKSISRTVEELKELFEEIVQNYEGVSTYSNSLAPSIWIVRGAIDYFDKLDSKFLGNGNSTGIPEEKADHYANNFYRLFNAINYLGRLWGIEILDNEKIKMLIDIRTLIVHSGEQISKIKSLDLEEYKDSQLGRIIHKDNHDPFSSFLHFPAMDYRLDIWNDKQDNKKKQKRNLTEVDYDLNHENFYDLSIFLRASDVRNIVLVYIENFIENAKNLTPKAEIPVLPEIKERVINENDNTIDFDKVARLVSNNLRGGYMKESGIEYWDGYGLKRLYNYICHRTDITTEVRSVIQEKIRSTMSNYWDRYQDESIPDFEMPSLDIRHVFYEYTPKYNRKGYLEGQKLFSKIAPFFNTRNGHDASDIDYLIMFINDANDALGATLDLEQTVDQLICSYIVQSVKVKVNSEE